MSKLSQGDIGLSLLHAFKIPLWIYYLTNTLPFLIAGLRNAANPRLYAAHLYAAFFLNTGGTILTLVSLALKQGPELERNRKIGFGMELAGSLALLFCAIRIPAESDSPRPIIEVDLTYLFILALALASFIPPLFTLMKFDRENEWAFDSAARDERAMNP